MALESTAVLEIGTSTVRVVVGELRDDGVVSVIGIGEAASIGIRKGEIINRDDVVAGVRKAIKEAEESLRKSIHSVILVTSGGQAQSRKSTGIHRLVDAAENVMTEVTAEDVEDVLEIARRVALPESRVKLHSIQQYFQVDDTMNVTNPVGLTGEQLLVDMLTIHGKRSAVENLRKTVDDAPISCTDAVFSGLCSALAVVNDAQKQAGVLVIDLGAGTTDFALYQDGFLQTAGSFAVGAAHITNDIAIGLQIPLSQAEYIKVKEGSALTNLMERDHNISIPKTAHGFGGKMVRAVTLNTIINARMDEIFTLVKDHIDLQCPNVPLRAGVMLTGGGSFLNGTRDLGQKVFNVPCIHGKPLDVQGLSSVKDGPLYASLVGAIRYSASLHEVEQRVSLGRRLINYVWGGSNA